MGKVCPKCGYERREHELAPTTECPQCGVIYERFEAARQAAGNARSVSHLSRDSFICLDCLTIGRPVTVTKGNLLIEIVLWIFFVLPGVLYSVWRHSSRYQGCPRCFRDAMIPLSTPKGRQLAKDLGVEVR